MNRRVVSFPHMGDYHIAMKAAVHLLGDAVVVPPKITRRSLEIGAKYSPEAVCIPFKYLMGNFIEVLEQGANVIVMAGGGCRLGMYGEVQKVILESLNYKFEFIKLTNSQNIFEIARYVRQIKPKLSYVQIGKALYLAYEKAKAIDRVEQRVRENVGFEVQQGSFDALHKHFLSALDRTETVAEIRAVRTRFETDFAQLAISKPERPLRVGIIGEIYVVMEPFSNFFVEKQLAQFGIETHRFITISGHIDHNLPFFHKRHKQHLMAEARPYLQHEIGGHGLESVAIAQRLAKRGFDGVIHIKPFGCMPEVNAMPALHKISRDYNMPIICFSFDTLTSETGIRNGLEAFYDMLEMKAGNHVEAY